MGFELAEDPHTKARIQEYFKNNIYKVITDNNWKQAMVPVGAMVLDNDNGTAPGLIMEKNGISAEAAAGDHCLPDGEDLRLRREPGRG